MNGLIQKPSLLRPLMTIYRNGLKPQSPFEYLKSYNQHLQKKIEGAKTFSGQTAQDPSKAPPKEPEFGVDVLFPCDVLQAHWCAEIISCCPRWITNCEIWQQEIRFDCPLEYVKPFLKFLKQHQHANFIQLDIMSCVDHLGETERFELSYGVRSHEFWNVVRVHTRVDELTHVPSATSLYGSAEPLENKIYDMYGIFFSGHPDLRRILTDYGFQGHPMRRDFPVTGYTEMRYDDSLRRIVYEPVEMAQELRRFDYVNPWFKDDPRRLRI